jgi:hypothetical protein
MLFRLDELERDVIRRRNDAEQQYWLGQLEGLDLTLDHLRRTRANTRRLVERLPSDDPFVVPTSSTATTSATAGEAATHPCPTQTMTADNMSGRPRLDHQEQG